MTYAGQFDALKRLQRYVGRFLFLLLTDTPDWFPGSMRPSVIPALRDPYPESPGDDMLERVRRIAEDADLESHVLRESLGVALAQWGLTGLVENVSPSCANPPVTEERPTNCTSYETWLGFSTSCAATQMRRISGTGSFASQKRYSRLLQLWTITTRPHHEPRWTDRARAGGTRTMREANPSEPEKLQSRTRPRMFEKDPDLGIRETRTYQDIVEVTFGPNPKSRKGT
jgi:hypothetical protein